MLINLLFWNTNRKALHNEIYELVEEYELNLIILVENDESLEQVKLLEKLHDFGNYKGGNRLIFKKAVIYYDEPIIDVTEVHGHRRYGIYKINIIGNNSILLCIVHFPSKINWGHPEDHTGLCTELRLSLERIEKVHNINKSIIVGDFNMNPFETGLISASGLNNMNVRSIALNKSKKIFGQEYKPFYNPMWNFFGEYSKGNVPGTHYYNSSKYINFYWNIYDQIMVRPELLDSFEEDDLKIICDIQGKSLLKEVNLCQIINNNISDHLPIFAKFNLYKS